MVARPRKVTSTSNIRFNSFLQTRLEVLIHQRILKTDCCYTVLLIISAEVLIPSKHLVTIFT